jgi:hypothetical protein
MSITKTKRYLVVLAAIGLVSVAIGGAGTFASFNAETTNAGNYFAAGTLLLHNTANGTTCTSESDTTNNFQTSGCSVLFSLAPITDSTAVQWASLTLTNAGTVNAKDIRFDAGNGCTTTASTFNATALTTAITKGATVTELDLGNLTGTIKKGDTIVLSDGAGVSQAFVADANVTAAGADTVVAVQHVTAAYSFTLAATAGTFTSFTGSGDLCAALQIVILETGSGFTGASDTGGTGTSCAYGVSANSGLSCAFDPSKTLATLPHPAASSVTLKNADGTTATSLNAGTSRYYLIGVKVPSLSNAYQSHRADFDLHWNIEQA